MQQRQLKKDYKFASKQGNNPVPTFDEVWRNLSQSDEFNNRVEDAEMLHDDPDTFDREEIIEEMRADLEDAYSDLLWEYENLHGEPCWRCVLLPEKVNPLTHPQLGTYWSIEKDAADCHWGKGKVRCLYEGQIEVGSIDWETTVHNRLALSTGEDEQEVSFLRNAPIFVAGVTVGTEFHPIGETRRC